MANATLHEVVIARPKGRVHPAYVRVTHLDQCGRHDGDDRLRMGDLQRLAVVPIPLSQEHHARRLVGWSTALAFRRDVALGRERACLCDTGSGGGSLSAEAAAAPAGRFIRDLRAALSGRLTYNDLSVYNAVQKALYIGVILAGILIVASGLSIWKPVQLRELTALFSGYDSARFVHFFTMAAIVVFLAALIVPKSLWAMIRGR